MSSPVSKTEKEKQKLIQEKCQTILASMLRDEDNKYCVDCDAKGIFHAVFEFLFTTHYFLFVFRTKMGFMESGYILVHSVCRNSP